MDERTRELAALAASVAARCQPCFEHHYKKAVGLSIDQKDIEDVITLANRISEVGGQRMIEFTNKVIEK